MLAAHVTKQILRACESVIEQGASIDGTAAVVALAAMVLTPVMHTYACSTTVHATIVPPAMNTEARAATVHA